MLTDRIIGALTFRQGVYAEVENDTTFTTTAWTIVAVAAFLSQLGMRAQSNVLKWLIATIIGTVVVVIGFAISVWVIDWVGREVFQAQVTFDELVRTLGLAFVWQAVGVLQMPGKFITAMNCLTVPVLIAAGLLGLAASLIALKEALDLEWVPTVITGVIGFVVLIVFFGIAGFIVGIFKLGVAAAVG